MAWTYEQNFNELTAGDLNGQDSWSGDTVFDVQSSDTFEGAQAISSVNNADLSKTITRSITGISAGTVYISFKLNRTAGTRRGGIYLRSGGTDVARIFFYNDGTNKKAQLLASSGWVEIEANLQNDTWYRLGIDFDDASQDNKYRCNINGGTWTDWYFYSGSPSWTSIDSIKLEDLGNNGSGTGTIYFDDISPNYISYSGSDIKSHSTLKNNLVSYWDLEEAGGTRYDLHGSNHLTDNNTVTSAAGKTYGNGADFESSNSETLDIADANQTGLDLNSDFSVSLWFKIESFTATNRGLVGKYNSTGDKRAYSIYLTASHELWCYLTSTGTTTGGRRLGTVASFVSAGDVGNWIHVVACFDYSAESWTVYKNGVSQSVTSNNAGTFTVIQNNDQPFTIGNYNLAGTEYFDGVIDEVGIWSKVLSTDEISDLYGTAGAGLPYYDPADIKNDTDLSTSLVSYWELNETSGTRTDSHGSNDLTDNGTVTSVTGKQGNAAKFDDSVPEYLSITDGSQSGLQPSGSYSYSAWVNFDDTPTTSNGHGIIMKGGFTSVNSEFGTQLYNSGGTLLLISQVREDTGSTFINNEDAWTPSTSTWYHIAVVFDATAHSLTTYINGVLKETDTNANVDNAQNGTNAFTIGGSPVDSRHMDGAIDEVAFWDGKALSVGEIRALYGYGTPPVYEATGGTDYPLTASAGSFILTGNATAFQKAWNMAAAVGSFTLTGIAVAFNIGRGYILEAAAGVFTLTGNNTAFSKAVSMIAAAGSFTLTGVAATLTKGKKMVASAGSFVVTFASTFLRQKPWGRTGRNTGIWTRSSKNTEED